MGQLATRPALLTCNAWCLSDGQLRIHSVLVDTDEAIDQQILL